MKLSDFIKKYGDCEVSEEMGKMIQKPKGKWMPGKGEEYWFICGLGVISKDAWHNTWSDNYRRDFLRIFKTEEEVERYLEIQKAFKKASFEPDWKNARQVKYYLIHNRYGGTDCVLSYSWSYAVGGGAPFYFENKEIIGELIGRFGKKDILKYIFGIEEDE